MQSLPQLTQFQIILFSEQIRYPLANKGQWVEYKGLDSVKQAVKAVLAVRPEGGTNMSLVFEEAFRYRAQAWTRSISCRTVCPTSATDCRRIPPR